MGGQTKMNILTKGRIWIGAHIKRNGVGVGVWVSHIVDELPELPNVDFQAGILIQVRNAAESQVYKNISGTWTKVDIAA
jgi:hypothetical protein